MKKLSVIIPVYNEKNTIEEVVRRVESIKIDGISKEIILIDDFSTDGTKEILNSYKDKHKTFFLDKNSGKGNAVRLGFAKAAGDLVIIQDADLEYNPEDYERLLAPILEKEADVVYGSRFSGRLTENNIIAYKRGYLFSRLLNWFSNVLSGLKLTDVYTCYKVFSKEAADEIHPKLVSKRFGVEVELTAYLSKNKFRIKEVPISYQGRTYREGKKINWKDGLAAVWHIIRFNLFRKI